MKGQINMKTNSTHSTAVKDFSRIPQTTIRRSTFNRSHGLKTAFDSGYLVPIECQEVLPGDDVNLSATIMARLGPCVTPPMDNVFIDTHWFFVPARLLWTNFTKMMGERVNPKDSIDYTVPTLDSGTGFAVGSLADYFGIPTGVEHLEVSALPFRAYAKIYDDWYRDENLQDSIIQTSADLGDAGLGAEVLNVLRKRGKRPDYFTSCLPWTQRGSSVEIPLGTEAPVYGDGAMVFQNQSKYTPLGSAKIGSASGMTLATTGFGGSDAGNPVGVVSKDRVKETARGVSGLYADLSTASAATINSLRMAFQLQVLLEQQARCGTRFVEILRGCFGTICPDARLQRSEYLGGSSDQIAFTTIAQTGATTSATPQGNLVSQAQVVTRPHFRKAFTEHGYIIGIASVRCDINYQYGLNRMWSRKGRFDYYWPALQHLGEQAVLNKEIYAQGANVEDEDQNVIDDKVFGYQERYAEYRYSPNLITGRLRSQAPLSLDVWHLAQKFTRLPVLDKTFIVENPPLKRILTVQDQPEILLDASIDQYWTRPMDTYGIPGLIDHL